MRSSTREREIELLSAPPFSRDPDAVTRYAFSEPYMRTLGHVSSRLEDLGFVVGLDPVGNLVARNCPAGVRAIGLGSHCDSVRRGGAYDGVLGVLAVIEVAICNEQHGLALPLQLISFVEEEASRFGQMLLGSRVASGQIGASALLDEVRAIDDGRSFHEHARAVGLDPQRADECGDTLRDLWAWLELHIEQGRVLEDAQDQIGVVYAIAGYVHADIEIIGHADHAGATPMELRRDAAVLAAECVLVVEQLACDAGGGVVATVGELAVEPGAINIVPGRARLSLDIRAPRQDAIDQVVSEAVRRAADISAERGLTVSYHERQRVAPVALDARVVQTLCDAVEARDVPWRRMISGAAHDTMCVARPRPERDAIRSLLRWHQSFPGGVRLGERCSTRRGSTPQRCARARRGV